MGKRIWPFLLVLVLLSFSASGCNYFAARDAIKDAEKSFANLKAQGGEKLVPYEYCSAESFLEVSKFKFKENNFQKTKEFAGRSKSASQAGLAEVQKKK